MQAASLAAADRPALALGAGGCSCTTPGGLKSWCSTMVHRVYGVDLKISSPPPGEHLERMVGRQALEIEFLKGALKSAPRPRSASTSIITGPTASPLPKDAG